MSVSSDDFATELRTLLSKAHDLGFAEVQLSAGGLHRRVGGYPGPDHRMPVCCSVMRKAMQPGDTIVGEPEKGAGASLCISYRLFREA